MLVFFLAAISVAGCRQYFRTGDSEPSGRYRSIMKQWSREARAYDGMDLQLLVAATYQSRAFTEAYVSEYARIYRVDPSATQQLADAQQQIVRGYYQFLVAAYVKERRFDDFDKTDSIWKIYLTVNDGKRLEPVDIQATKYADPKIRFFFPYVTPWKSAYIVRFPRSGTVSGAETSDRVSLEITGVAGAVSMVW